ncbi:peptidase S9, prolyl oligopeptidase active site region [Rubrobacter xylanophilus DSM 9941]|uniref:Peptidase S9, prolyl oligopeptidase active site region n=1 Tax=Rubrobacter xylanophilus (strain DSM 9941 / JCM 11954 / NBRC 16129 / PRD-1) TaxID=266117 RepID=Q1AYE9_RUBXD|nr:S9 family peptidase [Rubrobacter xylanophilus]ABG03579.1 peptidase S9, prolyl oligopeptidase active site region [Rubrobacter xylanophilus DSM 9941]
MAHRRTAPYGSWRSPLRAAGAGVGIEQLALSGGDLYWTESRPAEDGRSVLVRRSPDGRVRDLSPPPFDVRSRVHEYGGGAFAAGEGAVVFSNLGDGRLYRLDGGVPRPITPPGEARYADLLLDEQRDRVLCVREEPSGGGGPRNELVAVPLEGDRRPEVLVSGPDFVASPRLSPDGSRLAWLSWDLPNMPWDGTWLWTADLDAAGRPAGARQVAGGPAESVFQPEWSPRGLLYFVSDRAGWWNLYRLSPYGRAEPVCPMKAEFGVPQWQLGLSTYGFLGENAILCAYTRRGVWRLAAVNVADRRISPVESPFTHISQVRAGEGEGAFVGAGFDGPPRVARLDHLGRPEEVYRPPGPEAEPGYLSVPEVVEAPSGDGARVHAFLYRPANAAFAGPPGERPPLMVQAHGGPAGAARPHLDPEVQYWTSRGFAVLDVNYGGSSGFGRAYRERLRGRWGVVDVEDCAAAARHVAAAGEADGDRLLIRGWSAGGYTALAALAFREEFAAGASYFGLSDLEAFARAAHKFESRYLEGLVGPYPERADLYRERSPLHNAHRILAPAILFQGLEDRVVPPEQSRLLYERLRERGVPAALVGFEGEGHGFRREQTLRRAREALLYFCSRVLRFPLPEPAGPVEIANLPEQGGSP